MFEDGNLSTALQTSQDLWRSACSYADKGQDVTVVWAAPPEPQIKPDRKAINDLCSPKKIRPMMFTDLEQSPRVESLPEVFVAYFVYQWVKKAGFNFLHFQDKHGLASSSIDARRQGIALGTTSIIVYLTGPRLFEYNASESFFVDQRPIAVAHLEKKSVEGADIVVAWKKPIVDWCSSEGWRIRKLFAFFGDTKEEHIRNLRTFIRDATKTTEKNETATPNEKTKTRDELVSVCITHFNRPELLKQCLESIEMQTYENYEVILVDDGSTEPDAITYLCELRPLFEAKHWQLITQENRYLGAARNEAARHAHGPYLLFMDDDNVAMPNEIETLVGAAQFTKADIVTCVIQPFTGDERPDASNGYSQVWIPLGNSPAFGLIRNGFGDANALVRRKTFTALGGFTEDYGVGHEDWEFFAKASLAGCRIELVPEPLFYYRVRSDSMLHKTNQIHNLRRNIRPYLDHYKDIAPALLLLQGLFEKKIY
jgi:glycosyltransferase involved in cell wall biosynthesis